MRHQQQAPGNGWEELHKDGGAQNKKDIGDDDGLLLLDGAERVLLLVLP